jgi:hypothetical protein
LDNRILAGADLAVRHSDFDVTSAVRVRVDVPDQKVASPDIVETNLGPDWLGVDTGELEKVYKGYDSQKSEASSAGGHTGS